MSTRSNHVNKSPEMKCNQRLTLKDTFRQKTAKIRIQKKLQKYKWASVKMFRK